MTQKCSCHGSGTKHSQTIAANLERPRYSPGLILEDSDLTSAVDYTRSLSRLLFRNLFGCGVICGLVVSVDEKCGLTVTVAPGLALDGCGDAIEVPRPIRITLDQAEVEALESRPQNQGRGEFWVVLCGGEKMCAPRSLVCESDDFESVTQPTRIRALAEVSLAFERPECVCACGPHQEPVQHFANMAPVDDEVDCHHDHETRISCEADCGCGTACDCGCCLLLAHVFYGWRGDDGESVWTVRNRGVRRFIRPKLLPDPVEREEGWTSDMAARVVFTGESTDGGDRSAPGGAQVRIKRGQLLTQGKIMELIAREDGFFAERRAAENPSVDETAPAAAAAAAEVRKKGAVTARTKASDGETGIEAKREAEEKK